MDGSKKTDFVNKFWKIEEYPQGNKHYAMWKRFKQEKRSQQNTYNVLIESFSKFGITTNSEQDFFGLKVIQRLKVIQKFTELRNGIYESTKIQLNYILNLE